LIAMLALNAGFAVAGEEGSPAPNLEIAQADAAADPASAEADRKLKPRYEPAPVEEKGWYNSSYIFGMTKGVARSTMHPAVKAPLFLLVVPLDIVISPFAAIGGLFG
jgi:hypothetical protein